MRGDIPSSAYEWVLLGMFAVIAIPGFVMFSMYWLLIWLPWKAVDLIVHAVIERNE